jgi:acyl dehydratase
MRTFEDLPVGTRFTFGTVDVTEEAIIDFARAYDPQPFHVDPAGARAGPFGGVIASGWHTCALVMRLLVDGLLLDVAGAGSPGIDQIRFRHPVRPGDTLHARAAVIAARPSESKPDRGVITLRVEAYNQHEQRVLVMDALTIVLKAAT